MKAKRATKPAKFRRFGFVKRIVAIRSGRSRFTSQFSGTISVTPKKRTDKGIEEMTLMKNGAIAKESGQVPLSARDFAELGGRKLVYVRTVVARDVIDDLIDDDGEVAIEISDGDILYSVHSSSGERLALVGDRELAFAAARQYEMTPVSVH
jgi:hypothetical protein